MDRFGEKLRSLRLQKGLTLQELAPKLGYRGHTYLSEIESSKKKPTGEFILKVSRLFRVTTDSLMKDELEVDA